MRWQVMTYEEHHYSGRKVSFAATDGDVVHQFGWRRFSLWKARARCRMLNRSGAKTVTQIAEEKLAFERALREERAIRAEAERKAMTAKQRAIEEVARDTLT